MSATTVAKGDLKESLKERLRRRSPGLVNAWRTSKARYYDWKWRRIRERCGRLAAAIAQRHGMQVLNGPFQRLVYVPEAFPLHAAPKLLGCYEAELHPIVERIIRRNYAEILDVGSAEGYYAVGLARRMPATRIVAFDTDPGARELLHRMVEVNGVAEQVTICEFYDPAKLQERLTPDTLLFADCEGYETTLLDPEQAPALRTCDILVELHDCLQPGVTGAVLPRFQSTHSIALIGQQPRTPSDWRGVEGLSRRNQALAVREIRAGPQQWAFLTTHKHSG